MARVYKLVQRVDIQQLVRADALDFALERLDLLAQVQDVTASAACERWRLHCQSDWLDDVGSARVAELIEVD